MDFAATRRENDEKLLAIISEIETAEAINALVSFAKAYLGMFYVIDSQYLAKEKVTLLANEKLATAVFTGFNASLDSDTCPTVQEIAVAYFNKKDYPIGYVILAGMDLFLDSDIKKINSLPDKTVKAAICFHYTNANPVHDGWMDYLYETQLEKFALTHIDFWVAMLDQGAHFLPGIDLLLNNTNVEFSKLTILPVLQHWKNCKKKVLFNLMMLAYQHADRGELLAVVEEKIKQDQLSNEAVKVYWYAMAFILAPEKHNSLLVSYVGRVKLKVLPLLDFMTRIVNFCRENNQPVSDVMIASLLRIVAPIFPPQQHVYGEFGYLDINSRNVMYLFYQLACSKHAAAGSGVKLLRKSRVMKIYSGVLDRVSEIQMKFSNDESYQCPDFNEFINQLAKDNKLEGRKNKFDRK